jgi:hypothetical protein
MNERVSKLWDQAASECGYLRLGENSWDTQVRFINTFAELIVKECAEQIKTHGISASREDYGDYEIGFNAGLFHALHTTKEHFGVEE